MLLAWLIKSEGLVIRIQRAIVHLLAFVLFFAGSAREGEIRWSKALGFAMTAAVLVSSVFWLNKWLKTRKTAIAHVT